MEFTFEEDYPASVAWVVSTLTDRAFLMEYAAELPAAVDDIAIERTDGTWTVRTRLTADTRRAPSLVRPLLGPTVPVSDERVWTSDIHGARGRATVRSSLRRLTIETHAAMSLEPSGADACHFRAEGSLTVQAPFGGGRLAPLVRDLALGVFRDQGVVLRRWSAAR